MARLEDLPEELVELIFQEFALQIPIHRLIRLRLVSKSFDAQLMSPRVFTLATHEWHINFCQDKNTLMKWLRWSFCNPDCRDPTMLRFRQIVEQFLQFARKHHGQGDRAEKYNVDSVSKVLLGLAADQILIYRWKQAPSNRRIQTYNKLLLWRYSASLTSPEASLCVCLCIASAFGDVELCESIFEPSTLRWYPLTSQFAGIPVYAAVRFGQRHMLPGMLVREGHFQLCGGEWSLLDQAIYTDRHQQPPADILEIAYHFNKHHKTHGKLSREKAVHEVMMRALETAATYRNYKALETLLSRQEAMALPLSDKEKHRLLFAACLGQDSGYDMTRHVFALFPGLSPNCVETSPLRFAGARRQRLMRPLDAAICRGDFHQVRLLLDHGAIPDYGTHVGFIDLILPSESFAFAARQGFVNCMTLLLNADLGHHYLSGAAMVNASLSGDPAVVNLLLDAGMQLDAGDQVDAMANAYVAGTASVIELLRSRGYDCEAATEKGEYRLRYVTSTNIPLYS